MTPLLIRNGDVLELDLASLRGSEFRDSLAKIQAVPGRQFDFERKVWMVPADAHLADRILKTIRPQADPELLEWIKGAMVKAEVSLTTPLPNDAKLLIPWATKRAPWQPEIVNDEPVKGAEPWQRAAIDKLASVERAILADDMGLGKTFEAISAVEEWRLRNPSAPDAPKLVIAPASVVGGWERELKRWLGPDVPVAIIKGSYAKRKVRPGECERLGIEPPKDGKLTSDQVRRLALMDAVEQNAWTIINWEQLRVVKKVLPTRNGGQKTVKVMKEAIFEKTPWTAVIADEAHKAKNPHAQQTLGLWRCQGKLMYALTGTPIMNSPDEMWALLRWLWPDEYGNSLPPSKANPHGVSKIPYWTFYNTYVDYYEDAHQKKIITGVKNPDALRFVLRDRLIRRTSAILGLKGRKRIFFDLDLTPTQRALYDEAERSMWVSIEKDVVAGNKEAIDFARAALENGSVANLIRIPNGAARLVRLQQVLENAALLGGDDSSASMDDFAERFENSRPDQWVVFCKFKESCNLLADRMRKKYGASVGVWNGDVPPAVRTKLEDKFARGELDIMVGTIDAMFQGANFQNSHLMYFLTRDFVPAKNDQAEARQDRKGQQHQVMIYIPQPENTVAADKVAVINDLKQRIERAILPKDEIREEWE